MASTLGEVQVVENLTPDWKGALEEISTQNGPPKENNKIIVKIIK